MILAPSTRPTSHFSHPLLSNSTMRDLPSLQPLSPPVLQPCEVDPGPTSHFSHPLLSKSTMKDLPSLQPQSPPVLLPCLTSQLSFPSPPCGRQASIHAVFRLFQEPSCHLLPPPALTENEISPEDPATSVVSFSYGCSFCQGTKVSDQQLLPPHSSGPLSSHSASTLILKRISSVSQATRLYH